MIDSAVEGSSRKNVKSDSSSRVKKLVTFVRTFPRAYMERRKLLWALRGTDVECNLCGWQGKRFTGDSWHDGTICPNCYSDVRHRLLVASLLQLPAVSMDLLVSNKDVLHFAPEPQIAGRLRGMAHTYLTADLNRNDVDREIDIMQMSSIPAESVDLVIACDVLEHVARDRAALGEVYRVLRYGGTAILTVPQKDHAVQTYEDATIVTPEGRERAFGQADHLRIYGEDFVARVESAGFRVLSVEASTFSSEQVRRWVLVPPALSPHPLATNYRKIFFCAKDAQT